MQLIRAEAKKSWFFKIGWKSTEKNLRLGTLSRGGFFDRNVFGPARKKIIKRDTIRALVSDGGKPNLLFRYRS